MEVGRGGVECIGYEGLGSVVKSSGTPRPAGACMEALMEMTHLAFMARPEVPTVRRYGRRVMWVLISRGDLNGNLPWRERGTS